MEKVTSIEIITACKAIDRLMDLPMRPRNSYWLMRLSEHLEAPRNAYNDSEMKLISDLGLMECLDGAMIRFPDKEIRDKYIEAHKELDSVEVEIPDQWKIRIAPDDNLMITGNDMKALRKLVVFELPMTENEVEADDQ